MDENRFVALTAHLDGMAVVVKNIGKNVTVSEMELICLCNFAWIGLMETLFREADDGQELQDEIKLMKEKIRQTFSNEIADGINRLAQSTVGMLNSPQFEKYIVPRD